MSAAPLQSAQPVRPARFAHRGRVEAAGLYLDGRLLGDERARRRLLEHWSPGSTVYAVPGGYVLRWPAPLVWRVEEAPGTPLIARAGRLVAAPLSERQLDKLPSAPNDLVLVRGGDCLVVTPGADDEVDPCRWLALGALEIVEAVSLGQYATGPARNEAKRVAAREVLRDIPAIAPDLAGWPDGSTPGHKASARPVLQAAALQLAAPAPRGRWVRWLRRRLGLEPSTGQRVGVPARRGRRLAASPRREATSGRRRSWLTRILGRRRQGPARDGARQRESLAPPDTPDEARWRRRLRDWLLRSRFGRVIANQQERYLAHLLTLLRDGDLDEALRYAVPVETPKDRRWDPPGLGVPRPRSDLEFGAPRLPRRALALDIGGDLAKELEAHYRRAARRFEREGLIDRAAFVLFELLGSDEVGVSLLARYERYAEAARIAEGRDLPPGLVVRLYMLAGNATSAVRVAQRTGAFADAVQHLLVHDQTRALADDLRRSWARHLADAGDPSAALRVVWSEPSRYADLPLTDWATRAAAAGGVVGARNLVHLLELEPGLLDERWPDVQSILASDGPGADEVRWSLARTIHAAHSNKAVRAVARTTARTLVARTDGRLSWRDWDVLRGTVKRSGDIALRVDLPQIQAAAPRGRPLDRQLRLGRDEVGGQELFDAALLPNGGILIALGESGVLLVSPSGRTQHRFDAPAHALVVSDSGSRALAIAWRDRERRVVQIDLETRRTQLWGQLALSAFADTYDGARWLASDGDDLVLLDALAESPTTVWRARDVGVVLRLARDSRTSTAVVRTLPADGGGAIEVWRYENAGPTLRERAELSDWLPEPADPALEARVIGAVSPQGWLTVGRYRFDPGSEGLEHTADPELLVVGGPEVEPRPMPATLRPEGGSATSDFFVQGFVPRGASSDVDYAVWVAPWHKNQRYLTIVAEAGRADPVTIRALRGRDNRVLIGDSAGRALVYDLEAGEVATRFTV